MDNNGLTIVITIFVIISAIALCIQAAMLAGVYKAVKNLQDRALPLVPKAEGLLESAKVTVDQSRQQIAEITAKANQILDSTKVQMGKVDELITDASSRAKAQMERVEMVLDDTMNRAHETVATMHNGIMRPIREINGIAAGIKTAVAYLARGSRPSVAQATTDEEMFI